MTAIMDVIRPVLLVQPALAESVKTPTYVNVCQKPAIPFLREETPAAIRCMTHKLNT